MHAKSLAIALLFLVGGDKLAAEARPPTSFTLIKAETLVEAVLLRKGRPMQNVVVTSCAEYGVMPGRKSSKPRCDQPINLTTDSKGRLQFYQMSGHRTFTCTNPCSGDPASEVWFDIRLEGRTVRVRHVDHGFELSRAAFVCEIDKAKKATGLGLDWPTHLRDHAPDYLDCDVTAWER